MLCFLCSFSQGKYCYCRPGRPTHVVSTSDMLIIDTCPQAPIAPLRARRSCSEPTRKLEHCEFVRFRSLRENRKKERRTPRRPFRVSVVSIASSGDRKSSRRRLQRRVRQRVEAQVMSSSSSLSNCSSPPAPIRLPVQRDISSTSSETSSSHSSSSGDPVSIELQEINQTRSPSHFAVLVNGTEPNELPDDDMMPTEESIDKEIEKLKELATRINEGNNNHIHLEGLQFHSTSEEMDMPVGWDKSVSYSRDLDQYIKDTNANPFADPFEEEEDRRSRTEMWVESTSPGRPESDDEMNELEYDHNHTENDISMKTSEKKTIVPQVTVDECSEDSRRSVSLPVEPFDDAPAVEIQINGEWLNDSKKGGMERMDSLQTDQTEEPSSEASFVSSELEKKSLVKMKFRKNLDKAIDYEKEDVKIENVEKFWNYRYLPDAKTAAKHSKKVSRHRSRTPTVDRVVQYYTSDKRLSIASSASPSPSMITSDMSARSPGQSLHLSADSCYFQFRQMKGSNESSANPLLATSETTVDQEKQQENVNEVPSEPEIEEKDYVKEETTSESSIIVDGSSGGDVMKEKNLFRLDVDSRSDSEEGRVLCQKDAEVVVVRPVAKSPRKHSIGTSTEDLFASPELIFARVLYPNTRNYTDLAGADDLSNDVAGDVASDVARRLDAMDGLGKGGRAERNAIKGVDGGSKDRTMTAVAPTIIESRIEDADQEVELRLFDGRRLDDIETSSVEDLLAIDTRPNSSNHKSVSFSENLDVEIISPDIQLKKRRTKSAEITVKPILKKEEKHFDTMHKLMEYAGERLYKDLRLLIEERDRAVHALDITANSSPELSPHADYFHERYRDKMQENKTALDLRIDEVWRKLVELPLDATKSNFVFGVTDSVQLTLNLRRRILPRRHSALFQIPRKSGRSDLELASDYGKRLEKLRATMIRRDSENMRQNERSVEDILKHVSASLAQYAKV